MGQKHRILIVDDDPGLLRMIGMYLHRSGYEVFKAENGYEALRKVNKLQPDLVILDIMMPELDGIEVCRRLRAEPEFRSLPIIMLSAMGQVDDKVTGFEAGADDYVSKPVANEELLARTKALLNRSLMKRPAQAQTISLVGAKGGVGVTTAAINIAVTMANRGKSVNLTELRSHGGAIAHQIRVDGERDFSSILALDPERIKRPEIDRCIVKHASGLGLLLAPQSSRKVNPLEVRHLERIFDVLMSSVEVILLDLPPMLDNNMRRAMELSDQILLITEPEPLSVACARYQIEKLKAWEVYDKVNLVIVKRLQSAMMMNRIEVENEVGMGANGHQVVSRWQTSSLEERSNKGQGVISTIPAAPELCFEAVQEMVPLVLMEPNAAPSRAFLDLADQLTGEDTSEPTMSHEMTGYLSRAF